MEAPLGAKAKHTFGVLYFIQNGNQSVNVLPAHASTSAAQKLPFWNIQQVLQGEWRQPLSFHISLVRTWRSGTPALSTRCTSEGDEEIENTISVSSLSPPSRTRGGGVNIHSHGVSRSTGGLARLSPHVFVLRKEVADTRARCELAARD